LITIAGQLGLNQELSAGDTVFSSIVRYFYEQYSQGTRVILSIEDAHNMPPQTLAEIHRLASYKHENKSLVFIILVGRESLDDRSEGTCYKLEPLAEVEIKGYVEHRLTHAGWKGEIPISNEALNLIYSYSKGIPRFINILCDRLLLQAYLAESQFIDVQDLESAMAEIRQEPINNWLQSSTDVAERASITTPIKLVSDYKKNKPDVAGLDSDLNIEGDSSILDESEMLLSLGLLLDQVSRIKYNPKVAESVSMLQSRINGYNNDMTLLTQQALMSSSCCLYGEIASLDARAVAGENQLLEEDYQAIIKLSEAGRGVGVTRVIKLENVCKILDLASQTMSCIQLGVFASRYQLEKLFNDISGGKGEFIKPLTEERAVIIWRISISADVMIYLVGIPIDDIKTNNNDYIQLFNRLTGVTVAVATANDYEKEMALDEKNALLNALIFCGAARTQLLGQGTVVNKQPYLYFQNDSEIVKMGQCDDKKSLISTLLFKKLGLNTVSAL